MFAAYTSIIISLGICVVLPVLIVWLIMRKQTNDTNKRTEIILAALETLYDTDKQGKNRTFGEYHRYHKRYRCKDRYFRLAKALQTQAIPSQGDNP